MLVKHSDNYRQIKTLFALFLLLRCQMENKTMDDIFYAYINSYKSKTRLKQSTISTYINSYINYIKPYFADVSPLGITETGIMEYTNLLLKRYSTKTINDILTLLSSILNFSGITIAIYKPKIETKEIAVVNDNSLDKLIRFCSSHFSYINLCILIVVFTGMRIGEICALQWGDEKAFGKARNRLYKFSCVTSYFCN